MSQLTIYSQFNMRKPMSVSSNVDEISESLRAEGIRFEHRELSHPNELGADNTELTRANVYDLRHHVIEKVKRETGCQYVDLVTVSSSADSISPRDKYLSEHTHNEDEIRLFLSGKGLVYIHIKERIYIIECCKGDFIVIPKGVKHWFDMGPNPKYSCVRWYGTDEGLMSLSTGTYVAESTPRWESVLGTSPA